MQQIAQRTIGVAPCRQAHVLAPVHDGQGEQGEALPDRVVADGLIPPALPALPRPGRRGDPATPSCGGRGGHARGHGRRVPRGGRLTGGVERPGAGGGVARVVGWGVAAARTGPDRVGEGLDPTVGQVVPLAPGRRFYPRRGIGPIGSGGRGVGPRFRSSGSGIMTTADGNVAAGRSKSWTVTRR
jgi:hypothetical protein